MPRGNRRSGRLLLNSAGMKVIKTYGTQLEADLARIALNAEGISATVVGVAVAMEGGAAGVQLFVPDDQVEAALEVLDAASRGVE
jgi:hypothetical protein